MILLSKLIKSFKDFKIILLWATILYVTQCNATIIELKFKSKQRMFQTEQHIYTALKKNPILTDTPCVIATWEAVILSHFNKGTVTQANIGIKLPEIPGSFTVCAQGEYHKLITVFNQMGIKYLFSPHIHAQFETEHFTMIPILHYPIRTVGPAETKDILYSFIGFKSHVFRNRLFALTKHNHPDVIIKERSGFLVTTRSKNFLVQEYNNVLSRSRYSLCPRGHFPNSIRITESLFAGAIPVVLADDIKLPDGILWHECMLFIKEQDIDQVDAILRAISPEREAELRTNGRTLARIIQNDPACFVRHYFEKRFIIPDGIAPEVINRLLA